MWLFGKTAVALLIVCTMGVMGFVEGLEVYPHGVIVPYDGVLCFAAGGFGFVGISASTETKLHETGHLEQERMLGVLYGPLIALPSVVSAIVSLAGFGNHYDRWFERQATQLGGEE